MKKFFLLFMVTAFLLEPYYAASPQGMNENSMSPVISRSAKPGVDTSSSRKDFSPTRMNFINVKAVRHFDKAFSQSSEITWYATDIGFIVHFNQDGLKSKAIYDQLGNWQNTVRYHNPEKLPGELNWLIQREYFGYTITVAVEMEMYNKKFFWIKLENEKLLKAIKIYENEITELESYRKSL